MHGWILLDKPLGLGSTQGVSAVKRALRDGGYAKVKVGHGGTLDPLASGVLPIALGEATKLAGRMLDSDKVYDFTLRFGVETDTLDAEGKGIAESAVRPTLAELEAVLPRFTGPIEQVPPAYSALKVDGERAYDLARAGETVVLKSRAVTIFALEILPQLAGGGGPSAQPMVEGLGGQPPRAAAAPPRSLRGGPPPRAELGEGLEEITLRAHVSKGTYIRSLARDIAHALGTVGHVTYLRRIKAGPFTLDQAISLDSLADAAKERRLEDICLPLRAGLDDIPALPLTPDQAGLLRQGRVLVGIAKDDGLYFALLGDTPVALVEAETGSIRVVRGFNL
ncbi:tRNA pseudouridine(55) synthase TruB [Sphingomonas sp. ABOLD]|uniref:tRNA pseudouridine synthase B n=1 Tax=Sphingomonas trueperi TaxID=53317 RepID=A0A7X6BAK6_9SPHN|nr:MULTISPECIES: tRNA pseudouridine(55) synthase TruB [Sphingomonas]NJB95989.1 tRNA pseudouridine55 synthase [Sphingomonas trueperi]RSV42029.1 tRNA pseudouridine(55) synthase TruB [Sphingomonas sp. ABOLE]RSV47772.1 tRNA pseudouridine(55) synthase TruB [Sphingomonas sp. ABOLD]